MPKFMLIGGNHFDNGRVYSKGETINSPHDLIKLFPEKFRLVDGEKPAEPAPPDGSVRVTAIGGVVPAAVPASVSESGVSQSQSAVERASESVSVRPEIVPESRPAPKADKPLGVDVTARFKYAQEQDYKVYRHEGANYIYDADDLREPINKKGVSKEEVEPLIKKHLG